MQFLFLNVNLLMCLQKILEFVCILCSFLVLICRMYYVVSVFMGVKVFLIGSLNFWYSRRSLGVVSCVVVCFVLSQQLLVVGYVFQRGGFGGQFIDLFMMLFGQEMGRIVLFLYVIVLILNSGFVLFLLLNIRVRQLLKGFFLFLLVSDMVFLNMILLLVGMRRLLVLYLMRLSGLFVIVLMYLFFEIFLGIGIDVIREVIGGMFRVIVQGIFVLFFFNYLL